MADDAALINATMATETTAPFETTMSLIDIQTPANPAPELTWVSPAPGSRIGPRDAIVVSVEDTDIALLIISARLPDVGAEEVVFRNGVFATRYRGSSREVDGDEVTFTLRRGEGWPCSPTIQVDVCDGGGSVL